MTLEPAPSSQSQLLAFLAEISQQLAVSVDLSRTLRESSAYVARYLDAEAVSVFLLNEAQDALVCMACQGPVDILGLTIPIGKGIVGRAVAGNTCQMVREAYADPGFSRQVDAKTGMQTRSVLCAPLSTAQGVIGAIEVINKRGGLLFDEEDQAALRALAAPMALALNTARMAGELLEQTRIRRELGMARRLQRSLLPRRRRGSFPLRAVNLAAREVSGDFYDFFDLPDGRIAFTIGDVAGKGLDAAFLMVRCASLLRWAGKDGLRPSDWLAKVNDELGEALAPGMFVCAVAGHYDPATRELTWANAGFPPLLQLFPDGQWQRFDAESPPLGILRRRRFPEQHADVGDSCFYLYSDGATDVRDKLGRELGVEGALTLLQEVNTLQPEARLRALARRLREFQVTDDITLMLITGRLPAAGTRLLQLRFPAEPGEMAGVRHALAAALAQAGVEADLRHTLTLAVDEACTNIIRHAYGGACQSTIELRLDYLGDELVFELIDDAPCVDAELLQPRDLSRCEPGGLGLNFIDEVMDAWTLVPRDGGRGNCLRLVKRLESAGGEE